MIEGTLPAFYSDNTNSNSAAGRTAILTVPFALNRAVSRGAIYGIQARIKTVQSNTILTEVKCVNETGNLALDLALNNLSAEFELSSDILDKISVGQYLKVQLAFINGGGTVGYYSQVGITKYTTIPTVSILDLSVNPESIPAFAYTYVGKYSQKSTENEIKDFTERVYAFRFNLYDSRQNLVQTSDWQLHNSSVTTQQDNVDNLYESTDSYTFSSDLQPSITYYLEYEVKTLNGLIVRSHRYPVTQIEGIAPDLQAEVVATNNFENGYVELSLIPYGSNWTKGLYKICRSSEDSNYTRWEELKKIAFFSTVVLSEWTFKDFTVEQGKTYKYSLQQYNSVNLYSDRLISNEVTADFEDIFLYDGEKQLKIKYNQKVASFKIDRQEAKLETIGSKYPFIFRNGNIAYHEFPIAGLLSYLSDNDKLFLTNEELHLEDADEQHRTVTLAEFLPVSPEDTADATMQYYLKSDKDFIPYNFTDFNSWDFLRELGKLYIKNPRWDDREQPKTNIRTTNLVGYNYFAERIFKTAALEWLTNGKPKLFKSAGEGNFIVRLMNASMTPEDKLGRLLHTVSMTAYEVADNNYKEMLNHGFIDTSNPVEYDYAYETVMFLDKYGYYKHGKVNNYDIYGYLFIENMLPGDWVIIGGDKKVIGNTGSLSYSMDSEIYPDVYLPDDTDPETGEYLYNFQGQLTYRYLISTRSDFSLINNAFVKTEVATYTMPYTFTLTNIFETDIKKQIQTFYYLNFTAKALEDIYVLNNHYYVDAQHTIPAGRFLDTSIYVFHEDVPELNEAYEAIGTVERISYYTGDGTTTPVRLGDALPDFSVTIDGNKFLVENQLTFPKSEYRSIVMGNGVKVDCVYQVKTIVYNIELEDPELLAISDKESPAYLRLLNYKINELKKQIASEG